MKRLKLWLAGMSFLAICALPGLAAADVNDFVINYFKSDQTLTGNDPQGELRIIEHIDLTFSDNNHGILRAIPDRYKGHSLQLKVNKISSATGAPTQHTTYGSNGNTVLKIGDPDKTVTGAQQYTIDYTLRNVISFYDDHAELYWDVNGDQWEQPFNKVSVSLQLPSDLKLTSRPLCYAGSFGSTVENCSIVKAGDTIHAQIIQPLSANQTLTYVAGFEKGYFQPSKWYETVGEYWHLILGFTLPLALIGGTGFLYWWSRGRDPKGRGTIVPQYEPPDKLKPLAVGTILDFKADNRDITATIIDLAVRGYIKIIETKKAKRLRKDQLTYSLQLANGDFNHLDNHERSLIKAIFDSNTVGETVDISAKKNKLHTTASKLRTNVKKELTDAGYLRNNKFTGSDAKRLIFIISGLFIFIPASFIALGPGVISGIIAGVIVGGICLAFLDARTAKGVAAKEHILGLKLYLNTAEKDRLAKLQAPNAPYANRSSEPAMTVELFEKLLPYAMILGVEQQWAKQFESLYTAPPDWYSGGNWSAFNAGYLTSSLNSGIGGAVNSAFSAPSSSGSSGSGGGSSGGGGGGGGGGGW